MRRASLLLLVVGAVGMMAGSSFGSTVAAFSSSTSNAANIFEAASSFCGSQTLTATRDAWIVTNPGNGNNGTDTSLYVVSRAQDRRTFVGFDLPAIPAGCALTDARLRLHATSAEGTRTILAYRVGGGWTETGVTWNNQPGTSGSPASSPSGTGWREWAVLQQVLDMYASGNHGFVLRDQTEGTNGQGFTQIYDSREGGADAPTLVLTFG